MLKTIYSTLLIIFLSINANSQIIKNNSFENWTDEGDWFELTDWSGHYSYFHSTQPAVRSSESYDGNYALQIQANDFSPLPVKYKMAYQNLSETHFNGYYKATIGDGDRGGRISVQYLKGGSVVSARNVFIRTNAEDWTFFQLELNKSNDADSIYIVFTPSLDSNVNTIIHIDLVNFDQFVNLSENAITSLNTYPNPANDVLNVNFGLTEPGKLQTKLFAMNGQLILENTPLNLSSGEQRMQIDVNGLRTGIYLLELSINGKIHRQKVAIN